MIKEVALTASVAMSTLLAGTAIAQSGEIGVVEMKAAPQATQEETAAIRVARRQGATEAAKQAVKGEAGAYDTSVAMKSTPQERKAAAAKRSAAITNGRMVGESHGGEAGN